MRNFFRFCLFLIVFFPLISSSAEITTFKLKNGMQAIVIPNKKVPAVSHMVWYRVGAVDEVPGKTGLAHYLEHLMFKGTKEMNPGEFSKTVAINGGNDNAFTSFDYTAYFQAISKNHLEMLMKMESDRMQNLKVPEKEALSERDVILEERSSSIDNDPGDQLREKMRTALFGDNHPYGKSVIGWRADMEKLTISDAMSFYKKHYAPNNAILVVSGDVDPENVKKLAEKTYGKIKAKEIPERVKPETVSLLENKIIHMKDERVKVPELRRFYLAPSLNSENSELALPLSVLSYILGGGETSRLYKSLVVDNKIAASSSSSYDEFSLNQTIFSIFTMPKKPEDIEKTNELIDKEIQKIIDNGVTAEEIEIAVNNVKASVIYSRDSLRGLGYIYGQALASNVDRSYIDDFAKNIEKVTSEQIQEAAKLVLKNNYVSGVLER